MKNPWRDISKVNPQKVLMSKTNGWVKIHRKILETDLTASQFKFFVGSILLAKSPKSSDCGLVDLSVRQLSSELCMSRSEIWRREKELEKKGMLTILDKGFKINNYYYYQTGKSVPPTGQKQQDKSSTIVPPMGQIPLDGVPYTGQSVPPTGQPVPPTGQSVPSREAKSTNKKIKNNKNIKNINIIPNWIEKDNWKEFIEMRKKMKSQPTDRAKELLIKDLEKLKNQGFNPNEVIEQSIKNGWKGLFPLKGGQSGTYKGEPRALRPQGTYTRPEDYRSGS